MEVVMDNKFKNYGIEWITYTILYALILMIVSLIFSKSFYVDSSYYGIYAIIASLIISLLNVTIKPILVWLTLPITALTLGITYLFINVIILQFTDILLGSHFEIKGLFMPIVISFFNYLARKYIIDPIWKG